MGFPLLFLIPPSLEEGQTADCCVYEVQAADLADLRWKGRLVACVESVDQCHLAMLAKMMVNGGSIQSTLPNGIGGNDGGPAVKEGTVAIDASSEDEG
jgi:hypothetical protein